MYPIYLTILYIHVLYGFLQVIHYGKKKIMLNTLFSLVLINKNVLLYIIIKR